jgi:hypothetical protein
MRVDEHFKVARDFDAALAKLDPETDRLAVIESLMMAGTNYMNAVLHANKITDETFDLTHSYKPKPEGWDDTKVPIPLRDLMSALHVIEKARHRYARGIVPGQDAPSLSELSSATVQECLGHYRRIKDVVECVFARAAG